MLKPLVLITTWFGSWPAWINFYLETCKWNKGVDWIIITDQDNPPNACSNVRYLRMPLAEFRNQINRKLGTNFDIEKPYKICDLRPCLGFIFEEELREYSSFGWADLDVFFGDIRQFYTDDLLASYDMISAHGDRLSGHLAIFKNNDRIRNSFRCIRSWQAKFSDPRHLGLDEYEYGRLFQPQGIRKILPRQFKAIFREQHSTVDSPFLWHDGSKDHPQRWLWRNGRLTNDRDGERQFLYLHVMNWHSSRWRQPVRGPAPWPTLGDGVVRMRWQDIGARGFRISPAGITVA